MSHDAVAAEHAVPTAKGVQLEYCGPRALGTIVQLAKMFWGGRAVLGGCQLCTSHDVASAREMVTAKAYDGRWAGSQSARAISTSVEMLKGF
jgi:hypothetical protein